MHSRGSSPVVIVSKRSPHGSPKYSICVDYQTLNTITQRDTYHLHNTVELLVTYEWFFKLDLCSNYHQLITGPSDIEKTTFTKPGHHCQNAFWVV